MSGMSHTGRVQDAQQLGYDEWGACWANDADHGTVTMWADPENDKANHNDPLCVLDFTAVNLEDDADCYSSGVSFLTDPEALDSLIDALVNFRDEWKRRRA